MNCECGAWSRVLETRGTLRRRVCANNHRFTTTETVVVGNVERDRAINETIETLEAEKAKRDRTIRKAGGSRAALAERFGLSASQIYRIKNKSLRDVKSDL